MNFTRTDSVGAAVLVIEIDPLMLTAMGSVLDMSGYRAVMARTEQVANESIGKGQFDVIVLSIDELSSGCEFASRLRCHEATQDTPIIFLVPELTTSWSVQLSANGGVFSMLKPIDPNELVDLVEKALWMPHVVGNRNSTARSSHLSKSADWIRLTDS